MVLYREASSCFAGILKSITKDGKKKVMAIKIPSVLESIINKTSLICFS